MALTCQHCGAAGSDTAKFCRACGEPTAAAAASPAVPAAGACVSCGAVSAGGALFCKACGTLLTGARTAVAAGLPATRQPAFAPPSPFPEHTGRDTSHSPLWMLLIAAVAVFAMLAVAGWWLGMRPARQTVSPPPVAAVAADSAQDSATAQSEAADAAADVVEAADAAVNAEIDAIADTAAPAAEATPVAVDRAAGPAEVVAAGTRLAQTEQAAQAAKPAAKPVQVQKPAPTGQTAAQAPLRFIPVDPQVARTLPPPPSRPREAAPAAQGAATAAPPVQTAVAAPSSPEQACGKRVFLAMALCMSRQCETPQFAAHPQCVQLRQQNRDRQHELNQGR